MPEAREEAVRQVQLLNDDPEIAAEFVVNVQRWEERTPPIVGPPPQATVDEYTGRAGEAAIVVCVFGRRFGTEFFYVGRHYQSGTFYEFKAAERARRRRMDCRPLMILLYRLLTDSPPDADDEDAEQAANVEKFFHKLKRDNGGLWEEYRTPEEFGVALARKLRLVILKEFSKPRGGDGLWAAAAAKYLGLGLNPEASREDLIKKVRRQWVNRAMVKMTAGATDTFEIKFRANRELLSGTGLRRSAPLSGNLLELFDCADHQLLILGEQGSGKTFKLLELIGELLERAREIPTLPIPVVFNLSSWRGRGQSIEDWLLSELIEVYRLPRKLAQRWLEDENIVLCLDGLDEITLGRATPEADPDGAVLRLREEHRRDCLRKLNKYVEGTGIWLALCCRTQEYAALGVRLSTRHTQTPTITIEPLSRFQVKSHLDRHQWELESLQKAMACDRRLREMARTPFLLNAMGVAYSDTATNVILEDGRGGQPARLWRLLDRYVRQVYKNLNEEAGAGYSLQKFQRYLRILALSMEEGGPKHILVEQLQPDDWLPTRFGRVLYRVTVSLLLLLFMAIVVGLPSGAAIGFEWWWERSDFWLGLWKGAECAAYTTLCTGGLVAVGFALTRRWGFGVACGLALGAARTLIIGMGPKENWPQAHFEGVVTAAAGVAVLVPLMKHLCHARDCIRPIEVRRWNARRTIFGAIVGLLVGLVFRMLLGSAPGLSFGFMLAPIFALIFGYVVVGTEVKVEPNQGIRQSAATALKSAFFCAIAGMCIVGTCYGVVRGLGQEIVNIILGLTAAAASLELGAKPFMQHLGLRMVIAAYGRLPLRLVAFLEASCDLNLLRRMGGGYMFGHEYLREYFCTPSSPPEEDEAQSLPPAHRRGTAQTSRRKRLPPPAA